MPTHGLHPQDAAIVIEALSTWAGNPNEVDSPREERAWELIDKIAVEQRMPASELIRQIDRDWPLQGKKAS